MLQPIRLIQEYPIFRRNELPCSSGSGVTHIAVTSSIASMVTVGNTIRRFLVSNPRNFERELMHETRTIIFNGCFYHRCVTLLG